MYEPRGCNERQLRLESPSVRPEITEIMHYVHVNAHAHVHTTCRLPPTSAGACKTNLTTMAKMACPIHKRLTVNDHRTGLRNVSLDFCDTSRQSN